MKIYVILVAALFALSACKPRMQTEKERFLTVSIEPLRFFTQAIAGDKFRITTMVPDGSNPETYDPTPQQLVDLGRSKAFLRIGYIGYELVWADKLKQNAPGVEFFDMSQGVDLIAEEGFEHHGHIHSAGVEPHIWASTINAHIIIENICHALERIDPKNASFYKHNADSMTQVVQATDHTIRQYLKNNKPTFLIYHPSLSYFARDYGLTQLSIEEDGKEPLPSRLQSLIRQCREDSVRVIFIQKEFDTKNAEMITKEIGASVITINPLNYHWDKEMIDIAKSLVQK